MHTHRSDLNGSQIVRVSENPVIRVEPTVLLQGSRRSELIVSSTKFPFLFASVMILMAICSVLLAHAATERDIDKLVRSVELVAMQIPNLDFAVMSSTSTEGVLSARGRNILLVTLVAVVSISVVFGFYVNRLTIRSRRELSSRAAEEQENVETAKRRFIDTATHELNTPLTVTTALTDVLVRNREGNLTKRQLQQLEAIKRNNRNLVDLVDLMIQTSESGRIAEYPKEQVEYAEFLESTLRSIRKELGLSDAQLEWAIEPSTDKVEIYPGGISKVVSHLVINAVRHAEKTDSVRVFTSNEERLIRTCVVNSELVIPEQETEMLFTPFYRAETEVNRRTRGLGLGLTVVKQVVESYGGDIHVHSAQDSGTKFCFTLPTAA